VWLWNIITPGFHYDLRTCCIYEFDTSRPWSYCYSCMWSSNTQACKNIAMNPFESPSDWCLSWYWLSYWGLHRVPLLQSTEDISGVWKPEGIKNFSLLCTRNAAFEWCSLSGFLSVASDESWNISLKYTMLVSFQITSYWTIMKIFGNNSNI
jgi:hypothetical protein